jgi:hypothetical protein
MFDCSAACRSHDREDKCCVIWSRKSILEYVFEPILNNKIVKKFQMKYAANYFAGCDLNSMWDKRRLRRLSRYVVNCGTKFKSPPAK